jgi:hypothetical protein
LPHAPAGAHQRIIAGAFGAAHIAARVHQFMGEPSVFFRRQRRV